MKHSQLPLKIAYLIISPQNVTATSEALGISRALTQAISYIPYGEVFVEQQSGGWSSPYLFNAKELDSETGLYYYGARYLDPSDAMWLSVDPLWEKYVGMTPYNYCAGNPVKLVDVDGRDAMYICFPNYKIDTEIKIGKWKMPKVSGFGHAGVLLINNKTGETRYYEYGRYATSDGTKGKVIRRKIPNVIIKDGKPTSSSLKKVLKSISKKAGQSGNVDGAYIKSNQFEKMVNYAESKNKESNIGNKEYNSEREPYDLFSHNCATFADDIIKQDEEVKRPSVILKSPCNIVEQYQKKGHDRYYYDSKNNKLMTDENTK